MSTLDLDEIERLEKDATPGEWKWFWIDFHFAPQRKWLQIRIKRETDDPFLAIADTSLIAALRNAAPELIRLARIGKEAEARQIEKNQGAIELLSNLLASGSAEYDREAMEILKRGEDE